jgi:hypothetical protein
MAIGAGKHNDDFALGATVYNNQEEIFADVYSALIAGPLTGLSSQFYLDQLSQDELEEDDSDHPVSAIRPFIYADTLAAMEKFSTPTEKFLLNKWQNWLRNLWTENPKVQLIDTLFVRPKESDKFFARLHNISQTDKAVVMNDIDQGLDVNKDQLSKKIADIVVKIASSLYPKMKNGLPAGGGVIWETFFMQDPDNVKGSVDKPIIAKNTLYEVYAENVDKLIEGGIPEVGEVQLNCRPYAEILAEWDKNWASIKPRWKRILKADGWTTEGPTNPWD